MNSYRVEYLSVLSSQDDFCKSIESFNYLIQSYDHIEVTGTHIKFKGHDFGYEVQHGEINQGNQRFFHLKLCCDNSQDLDDFKKLLKSIRTILAKASGKPPEILWDDISTQLSCAAYPVLHEIENILRKLITKFMLTTVGAAWTKDTIPKEVLDSLKDKKNVPSQNYLHETDFIQLSNFLFEEYSTANSKKLIERLRSVNDVNELSIVELKEIVPQSNWERYFSPIVDCTSEYLENRWKRLYELRCVVAHNRFISKDEFDEIIKTSKDIKEKLISATDNLDKVYVSESQKEEVAENIASSFNEMYGEFIVAFNALQDSALYLYNLNYKDEPIENPHIVQFSKAVVRRLCDDDLLPRDIYSYYKEVNILRNKIVHQIDSKFSEREVLDGLKLISQIQNNILKLIDKMSSES